MSQEKIEITKAHVNAIRRAISLFESYGHMADFLEVNRTNVYLWARGSQLIPIKHAERLAQNFPDDIDVITLRPDILQYRKYL